MVHVRGVGRVRQVLHRLDGTKKILRRSVYQYWQNPAGDSIPIFLVGCGRSGTTMLVAQLAKTWQVQLYNEDHADAFDNWRLRDLSVIDDLIESSRAPFTIFKPILDTYRSRMLLSYYPTSKIVFAFRHYNDMVNSGTKRRRKMVDEMYPIHPVVTWLETDFAEFAAAPPSDEVKNTLRSLWHPDCDVPSLEALYWLFHNLLFFDLQLDQDRRTKLVQYESVVLNPEQQFKEICQFLGLKFEPAIADGVFASSIKREAPPEIDPDIRAECEALWQRLCQAAAVH